MNHEFPLTSFKCTCPDYKEVSFCLHIFGILIKLNYINADNFMKKKKRGRPPNITGALVTDPLNEN